MLNQLKFLTQFIVQILSNRDNKCGKNTELGLVDHIWIIQNVYGVSWILLVDTVVQVNKHLILGVDTLV